MAKKIKKKRQETEPVFSELELDIVGVEDSFEVDFDDKTNEIIFVNHYRKEWGDGFDADMEQALNMEDAAELIQTMLIYVEKQRVAYALSIGLVDPEAMREEKAIKEEEQLAALPELGGGLGLPPGHKKEGGV
jgi:hypothetical protein